jgi:hypothetical protein
MISITHFCFFFNEGQVGTKIVNSCNRWLHWVTKSDTISMYANYVYRFGIAETVVKGIERYT